MKRPLARPGSAIRKPLPGLGGRSLPGKARPLDEDDPFAAKPKYRVKSGGAFSKIEEEKRKQELNAAKPWNVIVPIGGSLTVYILDKDEPFACYEHGNYGGTKSSRGRDLPCIQDGNEPCPICASDGRLGSYVMYLTAVIPVETYEKKDGTRVTRHYQKKLLPIKIKMAAQWKRIYEQYGSFRGLVLKLHRDGKLDPISGNQVTVVKKLTEAEMRKYAAANDVRDKEAKDYIIKSKIDTAFDYTQIFKVPTAKQLAVMAGLGTGTAGLRGGLGEEDDTDGAGADIGSEWGES